MFAGIVNVVIDPVDDIRHIVIFHRCRHHDLFDARIKIGLKLGLRFEGSGAVDHHIDAFERQVFEFGFLQCGNFHPVNRDAGGVKVEHRIPAPMH